MGEPLKPCPWCQAEPKVVKRDGVGYAVACANDDCPVQPHMSFWFEHAYHAIRQWNRPSLLPTLHAVCRTVPDDTQFSEALKTGIRDQGVS
jgi:hypothetical protein